jgi:hypothetical protein
MRVLILTGLLALAACSQPATQGFVETPEIDPAVEAAVLAARPDFVITGAELDEEDGEMEVSGTLNGEDYELDLMQTDGAWRVTQIQRDVLWLKAPEAVRAAYAASPSPFEPVRVIESTDPADGAIYYQLFSETDQPGHPSVFVRLFEGEAAVMPPAH